MTNDINSFILKTKNDFVQLFLPVFQPFKAAGYTPGAGFSERCVLQKHLNNLDKCLTITSIQNSCNQTQMCLLSHYGS